MASLIRIRAYSSQVTHDFINSILARAQEATSKNKHVIDNSKGSERFARRGKNRFDSKDNNNNSNKKNRSENRFHVRDENSIRTKPSPTVPSIRAKQPQFNRSQQGKRTGSAQDKDMLDVLSSKGNVQRKVEGNNSRGNARNRKSHVVGTVNVAKRSVTPREAALRKQTDATTFEPFVPTRLSLLPYSTPIFNLPIYNVLNAAMRTVKVSSVSKSHLLDNYNAADSGIIDKDRFLSASKLDIDLDDLKVNVKGSYMELPELTVKDFNNLTKNENKKNELVQNAEIVKYALNANNIAYERKQILYGVCTGLKPVSELSELKG